MNPKKLARRTGGKKIKPTTPTRAFLLKYGLPLALIPGIILASIFGFNYEKIIAKDPRSNPNIFATHQQVVEVTDGDTIQLQTGLPIRLISINAPDSGEPYFNEATAHLTDLIGDKIIDIEYANNHNDPHGRLRGFAFISCKNEKFCRNGKLNLSEALVGAGLAKVSLYNKWFKDGYEQELKDEEKYTKEHKLNLWSISGQIKT